MVNDPKTGSDERASAASGRRIANPPTVTSAANAIAVATISLGPALDKCSGPMNTDVASALASQAGIAEVPDDGHAAERRTRRRWPARATRRST